LATYTKVPSNVLSPARVTAITAVAAGDKIDMFDVLGRPAQNMKIMTDASTDTITFRINNCARVVKRNQSKPDETVQAWQAGSAFPTFEETGDTVYEYGNTGLEIHSIEIVSSTAAALTITVF